MPRDTKRQCHFSSPSQLRHTRFKPASAPKSIRKKHFGHARPSNRIAACEGHTLVHSTLPRDQEARCNSTASSHVLPHHHTHKTLRPDTLSTRQVDTPVRYSQLLHLLLGRATRLPKPTSHPHRLHRGNHLDAHGRRLGDSSEWR